MNWLTHDQNHSTRVFGRDSHPLWFVLEDWQRSEILPEIFLGPWESDVTFWTLWLGGYKVSLGLTLFLPRTFDDPEDVASVVVMNREGGSMSFPFDWAGSIYAFLSLSARSSKAASLLSIVSDSGVMGTEVVRFNIWLKSRALPFSRLICSAIKEDATSSDEGL